MPTLAAHPGMIQRARKHEGLRVCRAAWLIGVSVREYREIEAGHRIPDPRTYERISELYGWPKTFAGRPKTSLTPSIPSDAHPVASWKRRARSLPGRIHSTASS